MYKSIKGNKETGKKEKKKDIYLYDGMITIDLHIYVYISK